MRTVLKFGMSLSFAMEAVLDDDAKVVMVAMQRGTPTLWIENDPTESLANVIKRRMYRIFPTGFAVPEGWTHVGSFQDGDFVGHVYETRNP